MANAGITLLGCGDIGPIHPPMEKYAEQVASILADADFRFAQVERVYSDRGNLQIHSHGGHSRVPPGFASVFSDCGIDIASLASNHAMDWGEEGLLDTIEELQRRGITTLGAGRNLEEARKPVIVEKNGLRIGFLAYCAILREGYAATSKSAGVAPLRVRTFYEPIDYQPGAPARTFTVPYPEDKQAILSDIAALRPRVDFLVVSMHWGVHFVPRLVADYQIEMMKAVFDAGADLILGHHAHVPKAIQTYKGKVCFHSLSNFIMTSAEKRGDRASSFEEKYGVRLDPDYPNLAYGADAKLGLVAKAHFSRGALPRVSFLPSFIQPSLQPYFPPPEDERFHDILRYLEWASEGFEHAFTVEGSEVIVHA